MILLYYLLTCFLNLWYSFYIVILVLCFILSLYIFFIILNLIIYSSSGINTMFLYSCFYTALISLSISNTFVVLILVIIFVVFSVILFSAFYVTSDSYFYLITIIFVFSILILLFSNNLYIVFVGWDGLGLSSFFLICYYSNYTSQNNSILTMILNRIGDGLFLYLFSVYFYCSNHFVGANFYIVASLLILIMACTNSAQYPFSAWLPAAMSAPTPISALVHSSTLVIAGVILLLNFYYILYFNTQLTTVLLLSSVLTLNIAGFVTLVTADVKKLIAFSTLSQISFLFLSLLAGNIILVIFHTASHALFNSVLFILVGIYIVSSLGLQDIRFYNSKSSNYLYYTCICVTLFCLCGLLWLSGIYSNELVVEILCVSTVNHAFVLFFLCGLFFTFYYSVNVATSALLSVGNYLAISVLNNISHNTNSVIYLVFISIVFGAVFGSVNINFYVSVFREKWLYLYIICCFIILAVYVLCISHMITTSIILITTVTNFTLCISDLKAIFLYENTVSHCVNILSNINYYFSSVHGVLYVTFALFMLVALVVFS